jgi:hypothetical protein
MSFKKINQIIRSSAAIVLVLSLVSCDWLSGLVVPNETGSDAGGTLIISEVGSCPFTNVTSWFEVFNDSTNDAQLSTFTVRTYGRLKESGYDFQNVRTYSLPTLTIPVGGYAVIRGATDSELVNGPEIVYITDGTTVPNWVFDGSSVGSGFIELLKDGETVDFVRWGSNSASPTTAGNWATLNADSLPTGSGNYGYVIARDSSNSDTNVAADWTSWDFATPGGPNDVTSNADTDSDGIPDSAEVPGGTFAGLPLYDWGARTTQRDIFVHIDYMNSTDPGITPQEDALDKVVTAFENSTTDLRVHFDVGDLYTASENPARYNMDEGDHQVPFHQSTTLGVQSGYSNVYEYKNQYMPLAKRQVFHYLLFANSQRADGLSGSSGLAEKPGNDFLVTLGSWGLVTTPALNFNELVNFQASTVMHELGHNLGLSHGGNESDNFKPNYLSIMNYLYQLNGLATPGAGEDDRFLYEYYGVGTRAGLSNSPYGTGFLMNYSHGNAFDLDETDLNETTGFKFGGSSGPVNFNNDADTSDTGLSQDIDDGGIGYGQALVSNETISDYDDWGNIYLFFQREWSGDTQGATRSESPVLIHDVMVNDFHPVNTEKCLSYEDVYK